MSENALTFHQLRQMMAQDVLNNPHLQGRLTDLSEGSITLGLLGATAVPMEELMYRMYVDLPARYYLDEAKGEHLDRLVKNFTFGQVKRRPASKAIGPVRIVGEPGAVVAAFQRFVTPGGVLVELTFPVAIGAGDTEVLGEAKALSDGSAGNLLQGVELIPLAALVGITRVEVAADWGGGADVQSDAELVEATVEFLDSLVRGVRPAIHRGCREAGYPLIFIQEPGSGRFRVWCDDGAANSASKLEAARLAVHRAWKAAGAYIQFYFPVDHPLAMQARAFSDGTVAQATLEAGIQAKWAAVVGAKRMGEIVTRIELIEAASTVPGYNGVNITSPAADLRVKLQTDEYGNKYGLGDVLPYERLILMPTTWEV